MLREIGICVAGYLIWGRGNKPYSFGTGIFPKALQSLAVLTLAGCSASFIWTAPLACPRSGFGRLGA
jgi:hypothetical protein